MEQTISLKNLIFQVFFQWRKITTFALIMALGLGGYQGYKQIKTQSDPELLEEMYQDYEDELHIYTTTKERLEASLLQLENQYQSNSTYGEESILMSFDPYHVYNGSVQVYLDSYFEIIPSVTYQNTDMIHQLMIAYQNKLNYGEMYSDIAIALGLETEIKYIKELISISYNSGASTITFTVRMDSEDGFDTVAEVIEKHVLENYSIIQEEIADHGFSMMRSPVNVVIEDWLDEKQETFYYDLTNLMLRIVEQENNIKVLDRDEPEEPNFSTMAVLKYFVIGAVVGGVLSAGTVFVVVLFSNKLEEESFIENELHQLVLGVCPVVRCKGNAIDKILEKIYNNTIISTEEEFISYVGASLKSANGENLSLHFCGSISETEIKSVYEKLKLPKNATVGGFILQDTRSLELMEQAQAVVLVEKRNMTSVQALDREIKYLEKMNKKILGVLVL